MFRTLRSTFLAALCVLNRIASAISLQFRLIWSIVPGLVITSSFISPIHLDFDEKKEKEKTHVHSGSIWSSRVPLNSIGLYRSSSSSPARNSRSPLAQREGKYPMSCPLKTEDEARWWWLEKVDLAPLTRWAWWWWWYWPVGSTKPPLVSPPPPLRVLVSAVPPPPAVAARRELLVDELGRRRVVENWGLKGATGGRSVVVASVGLESRGWVGRPS